ncbi:urotensin-2-like isoform X3 [Oreochromis niloticus]|uniref:urotensin-2-like isoform X3 n=1 Tax=Oreochromis niloticus TaxID=8128 RepID=UPI000DF2E0FB|nr:urotensin-2-like isoform X3 [Oreochromis niloticus]
MLYCDYQRELDYKMFTARIRTSQWCSYQLCGLVWSSSVSAEDRGISSLDDLPLSEQDGAGLRYSTLISGVRTTGLLPRGLKREVLLEKQSLLNPFSHALGIRKQFRKRGGNSECFWKYCV